MRRITNHTKHTDKGCAIKEMFSADLSPFIQTVGQTSKYFKVNIKHWTKYFKYQTPDQSKYF